MKSFSKLKEEKTFLSKEDIMSLLKKCIAGEKLIADSKLEKPLRLSAVLRVKDSNVASIKQALL